MGAGGPGPYREAVARLASWVTHPTVADDTMSPNSHPDPHATAVRPAGPDEGLTRLGRRPALGDYLRETWRRRDYALHVPLNEIRVQNRNTMMGSAWLVLTPLLSVGVYFVAFGLILRADRGVDSYLSFLTVGVFTFFLTQRCVGHGAKSIVSNIGLIRAIQFPRILLPVSEVIGQAISYLPVMAVMLIVALADGADPRWSWLALPGLVALQLMFSLGIALVAARLNYAVRDLENTLPFMFRLLFYLSGVLYSVERLVASPVLRDLFALNPMYSYVTVTRWAVLGVNLPHWTLVSIVAWSIVMPVFGLAVFRLAENDYGRAS